MRTTQDVIRSLDAQSCERCPEPVYNYSPNLVGAALSVPSMRNHMSDEGWQIMLGLRAGGYALCGSGAPVGTVDVRSIVNTINPTVAVVQDKREWDTTSNPLAFKHERFKHLESLRTNTNCFKLTIVKDSHHQPEFHRRSAMDIGCNAWICYYHQAIVTHLAKYVRPEHLLRTYHTLDPLALPALDFSRRTGALLSGALGSVYPLRRYLVNHVHRLVETDYLPHPGYVNHTCHTPTFLRQLTKYKVAICTTSVYGYALRKLIEATACGCVVITDLPSDDILPYIDGNLIRIDADQFAAPTLVREVNYLLKNAYATYNPERQRYYAELSRKHYTYEAVGHQLISDIETLRSSYGQRSRSQATPIVI